MKNPSAALGCGEPICIPRVCEDEVDYEAELAVIIGRTCRNATRADALTHVAGYTAANDVSARVWQKDKGGGQWNRGKDEGPNLGYKLRHKEGYFPVPPADQMMDLRNEMM